MDPMLSVPDHPHDQVHSASKVRICFALEGHRAVEETPRLPGRVSTSSGQQAQGKAVVGQGEARTPSFGAQNRLRVVHVGVGLNILASLWCGVVKVPYQITVSNRVSYTVPNRSAKSSRRHDPSNQAQQGVSRQGPQETVTSLPQITGLWLSRTSADVANP